MKIRGKFYPSRVFVAEGVKLEFPHEEIIERINAGQIGAGVKLLAGTIGRDVILGEETIVLGSLTGSFHAGKRCVFGRQSLFKGGSCGDFVTVGSLVIIKGDIKIGSHVQIGDKTTLNGDSVIEDYVVIGSNCALESVIVENDTVIGNHVITEGNPRISAKMFIPSGSCVLRRFSKPDEIEVVPY